MPQYDMRELRGNSQFRELLDLPVKEVEYPLSEGPSRIGEALTEGLKAFPQLGLSALDLGASLGSGMVAWPLGKLAGGATRTALKIKDQLSPEGISSQGEMMEDRLNELLSIPPGTVEQYGKELLPSVFDTAPELGRKGGELIGTGIERGMEFIQEKAIPAIPLFNVPKVSELAKTNPNEAWLLATVEELVTFGLLGKGFRVTKNRLLGKNPKDWTTRDWADAEKLRQKVKEAKQNEKAPQHLLEALDDWIDGEYTVEPQRAQLPEPQRLLEAPREGAPGGGTDLAPEGPPSPGLKPAPKRTLQPGETVEIGTPSRTAEPPPSVKNIDKGKVVELGKKRKYELGKAYKVKGVVDPFVEEPLTELRIKSVKPGEYREYTGTVIEGGVRTETKYNPKTGKIEGPGTVIPPEKVDKTTRLPDYWIEGKNSKGEWVEITQADSFKDIQKQMDSLISTGLKEGVRTPKKGASPETLEKARKAKGEKAKSKIGKTEITQEALRKKRSPEEAEAELRALVPEVRDYLDGKVADPTEVKNKINEILSDLDPYNTLHSDVVVAGERLLTEISKKEKPFVEEWEVTKKVEKPDPYTKAGARRIQNEIDLIRAEAKDVGVGLTANVIEGYKSKYNPEKYSRPPAINVFSIRQGWRGKGKRELFELIDDVIRVAARNDMAIEGPVINLEVGKLMNELGAQKSRYSRGDDPNKGSLILAPEIVKDIANAGGVFKYKKGLRDAKRIRENERQVSEGRAVEEGRATEGRTDLELEAPKEPGGTEAQGTEFKKVKAGLYKSADGEVYIGKENNKWWITDKDGNVQNAEGYKSLREAKGKYAEIMGETVEEMLPTKSEVWNSDNIRKYMEELAKEKKVSGEELEARVRDVEETPTDIEDFLYGESPKDRFFFDQGESLDGYTIRDAAKDAWEFSKGLFTDESGSISFGDLSPEDIARLDRLRRKAKQMGEDLRDFLRKAGYAEKDIGDIMEFVEKYLDTPVIPGPDPNANRLDMADDAILFQNKRTLKARGYRKQPVEITEPPYYAKYLKGWVKSEDLKIGQIAGRSSTKAINEFTLPYSRIFERGPEFLKRELFDFYNSQRKKEGIFIGSRLSESKYWRTLLKDRKNSGKRIYDYAISQQEGGEGLLAENGRVKPKLDKTEMMIYEEMIRRFEETHPMVVRALITAGKNPFKQLPHYFTFARAMGEDAKVYKFKNDPDTKERIDTRPLVGNEEYIDQSYMKVKAAPFRYKHSRVKEPAYKLKDDAFDVYDTYMKVAGKTIHITPVVAKARTILSPVRINGKKVFDPRYQRPNTFRNINKWSWDISGVPSQRDIVQFKRPVEWLQGQVASAMLLGNFRTGLIQTTALRNTLAQAGEINTLYGISKMMSKAARTEMMRRSNHMLVRSFDAFLEDSLGTMKDLTLKDLYLPENFRDFKRLLGKMIGVPDRWAAGVSWWAKVHELERVGVTGEKAAIEADNFVINTQGSGDIGHRSAIQNRVWGKILTTFQTFTINDFRFLLEDGLGIGRKVPTKKFLPTLLRYFLYTAAINHVLEDWMKIKSPFPRPIKVGWEGVQEGKPFYEVAVDVGKELIEPWPFFSSLRYGKPVTGVMSEVINNVFTGGKYGVTSYQEMVAAFKKRRIPVETLKTIGIFLGIPGTNQMVKSYRAYRRGEIPWNVFWGNFTQHVQKYAPPPRSRRARRVGGPSRSSR